eukprot:g6928.t1
MVIDQQQQQQQEKQAMTTKQQLQQARDYLTTLHADREESCSDLEEEAKVFRSSPCTDEQERRFRLIYQLVRYQIHIHTHNMYAILQEKLAAMARVQATVGNAEDDPDVKELTIALVNGRIVDATIRVIERAIEAMRELNGRNQTRGASSAPIKAVLSGWDKPKKKKGKRPAAVAARPVSSPAKKSPKRSRLPAAAVKEMRTWLDEHWDDPVPTHEEKAGFAQRHEITTKQVENWFINIRMREWRPAMRRALDHAEETGSYAEFSRLLQHTADGNVFKKFLEEREMGRSSALVPPPSLQRFIGAQGFAAFSGDRPRPRRAHAITAAVESCCIGEDLDCSASSVEHQGQRYYCINLDSPEVNRACVQCLSPTASGGLSHCSSCCGAPNMECDLEWSWGAVLATLSVSAVFATCSGILALAEKRRKRKGMSLARAWSIPHGMPVLRATVVDLSDAVRGRASIWSVDGLNSERTGDNDLLEHVGLLEEIPSDSIYGALVEQQDEDIPVAKLAEDNWVTAMAWRQQVAANSASPEGPTDVSDRWMSARAMARQSRRINSGSGDLAVTSASTAFRSSSTTVSPGAGGSGWERQGAVVVVGDASSERSEEEEGARTMLAPGRQSGRFSL